VSVQRDSGFTPYLGLPVGLLGRAALFFETFEHVPEASGRLVKSLKGIGDAFEFGVAFEGFDAANEIGAGFFDGGADAPHVIFEALGDIKHLAIHLFLDIQDVEEFIVRHTLRRHRFHRKAGRSSE